MSKAARKAALFKQAYIRSDEARVAGVHPALLSYYQKKGVLERVERGLYRNLQVQPEADFQWEDLIQTVKGIKGGVVTGVSALSLYGLTDEIPRLHWIAIPHDTSFSKRANVRQVRLRNHKMGQSKIKIGELEIPIFDIERTLVDAFRLLSTEVAIKALKRAFSSKSGRKPDVKKIASYAKRLRVDIDDYLIMVTT